MRLEASVGLVAEVDVGQDKSGKEQTANEYGEVVAIIRLVIAAAVT
jgi:hypothetical protein